jgi:hypothetical protein
MLRQKAKYSKHPYDETARWRHLPIVVPARGKEHGLDELGERVRGEPGDEQDQQDTSPGRLGDRLQAPVLLAGAALRPWVASARRRAR